MNSKSSNIIIRSGYPLSSDEFNEIFEQIIFDASTILSTSMPNTIANDTLSDAAGNYFIHSDDYAELLNQSQLGVQKDTLSTYKDHTPDWRRI